MGQNGPPPPGQKPAPPPPPPPAVFISTPMLTPEAEERLRLEFERAQQTGRAVILPDGVKVKQIEPPPRPTVDCEYCGTLHNAASCPSCSAPPTREL